MKKPRLTLPQPKIFKELHGMRMKVRGKAARLGWKRYLAEMNQRAGHLLGKPPAPPPTKSARKAAMRRLGLIRQTQATRPTVSAPIS